MRGEQRVTVQGVEFVVTTAHAASSDGRPVVVCPDGEVLGPTDPYETEEGLVTGAERIAATRAEKGG